jgi:hypothetical protein
LSKGTLLSSIPIKIIFAFLISLMLYTLCLSHLSRFHQPNIREEEGSWTISPNLLYIPVLRPSVLISTLLS